MNQQKKVIQSYRDLEVYKLSYRLAVEIDAMTKQLPKHEFWEEGQQIRKSSLERAVALPRLRGSRLILLKGMAENVTSLSIDDSLFMLSLRAMKRKFTP